MTVYIIYIKYIMYIYFLLIEDYREIIIMKYLLTLPYFIMSSIFLVVVVCSVIYISKKPNSGESTTWFKKHVVFSSFILIILGIGFLVGIWGCIFPLITVVANCLLNICSESSSLKVFNILDFYKKIGFTGTITILLTPYFYVLWVWRHRSSEINQNHILYLDEQMLSNLYQQRIEKFDSGSSEIKTINAESIVRLFDNPSLKGWLTQEEHIHAISLLRNSNKEDYCRIFFSLEKLQLIFNKKWEASLLPIESYTNIDYCREQKQITNGVLVLNKSLQDRLGTTGFDNSYLSQYSKCFSNCIFYLDLDKSSIIEYGYRENYIHFLTNKYPSKVNDEILRIESESKLIMLNFIAFLGLNVKFHNCKIVLKHNLKINDKTGNKIAIMENIPLSKDALELYWDLDVLTVVNKIISDCKISGLSVSYE